MGLILIAGMRRSGSTVAFQIAQRMVGGKKYSLGYTETPSQLLKDDSPVHVAKTHSYLSQLAPAIKAKKIHVITTYRDPRDIAISMMNLRKKSFDEVMSKGHIQHAIEQQTLWENVEQANHLKYELFYEKLWMIPNLILNVLSIAISSKVVKEMLEEFSMANNKAHADKLTNMRPDLLTPGHVQDGSVGQWKGKLDDDQLNQIYAFAGEWMTEHGYER